MIERAPTRVRVLVQVLVTLIALPFALPVVVIVAKSFDGAGFLANYGAVLTKTPFLASLRTSALISASTIAVVYVCTMTAAYAFAKMRFAGRGVLFNVVLGGLVLPGIALIVPLFVVVARLDLFDNLLSVVVPLSAGIVPFTILLTRNYLASVPDDVLEAARIDGCGSVRTLLRVVLPLAKPITAVVVVWAFLQSWNEFFLPLLFLQDPSLATVTTIPAYFTSTYGSDQPKIFAALVLICLPIVVAYLSLQRFFERGLTAGAVK